MILVKCLFFSKQLFGFGFAVSSLMDNPVTPVICLKVICQITRVIVYSSCLSMNILAYCSKDKQVTRLVTFESLLHKIFYFDVDCWINDFVISVICLP